MDQDLASIWTLRVNDPRDSQETMDAAKEETNNEDLSSPENEEGTSDEDLTSTEDKEGFDQHWRGTWSCVNQPWKGT